MKFFYEQFSKLTKSQIWVFGETLKTLTSKTKFPFKEEYKDIGEWTTQGFIRYLENAKSYCKYIDSDVYFNIKTICVTILCTLHKMTKYYENN